MENHFLSKKNFNLLYSVIRDKINTDCKIDLHKKKDKQIPKELFTTMKDLYSKYDESEKNNLTKEKLVLLNKKVLSQCVPIFKNRYTKTNNIKPEVPNPMQSNEKSIEELTNNKTTSISNLKSTNNDEIDLLNKLLTTFSTINKNNSIELFNNGEPRSNNEYDQQTQTNTNYIKKTPLNIIVYSLDFISYEKSSFFHYIISLNTLVGPTQLLMTTSKKKIKLLSIVMSNLPEITEWPFLEFILTTTGEEQTNSIGTGDGDSNVLCRLLPPKDIPPTLATLDGYQPTIKMDVLPMKNLITSVDSLSIQIRNSAHHETSCKSGFGCLMEAPKCVIQIQLCSLGPGGTPGGPDENRMFLFCAIQRDGGGAGFYSDKNGHSIIQDGDECVFLFSNKSKTKEGWKVLNNMGLIESQPNNNRSIPFIVRAGKDIGIFSYPNITGDNIPALDPPIRTPGQCAAIYPGPFGFYVPFRMDQYTAGGYYPITGYPYPAATISVNSTTFVGGETIFTGEDVRICPLKLCNSFVLQVEEI